jgi:hypothetical protein
MPFPLRDIANQNFQPGSDYLKSIANAARKSYCSSGTALGDWAAGADTMPIPLKALMREIDRSICELPEEPVVLPPVQRSPSNAGSCECAPYEVKSFWKDGSSQGVLNTDRFYGPVTPFQREVGAPPNVQQQVGLFHRGIFGSGCQPAIQETVKRSDFNNPSLSQVVVSIAPYSPNPPAPIDCVRPTLPTDRTARRQPTDRPVINIPVPNLPDITIPVIPVPLPVLPGVKFEPKLVVDVGGINIEFGVGDVDFSFSPVLVAPIFITPPGTYQPSLPPGVQPLPSDGGVDCCDELLAAIAAVDGKVELTRSRVIDVENIVDNIQDIQLNTEVPLLKDIQDCACLPDTQLFQVFNNFQSVIFPAGEEEVAFATVTVTQGGDIKKTFGAPGGETVSIVGWYAFGRSGRQGERKPLQYINSIMQAPGRGWNTFTYSLYNGMRANCQIFTFIKDLP